MTAGVALLSMDVDRCSCTVTGGVADVVSAGRSEITTAVSSTVATGMATSLTAL